MMTIFRRRNLSSIRLVASFCAVTIIFLGAGCGAKQESWPSTADQPHATLKQTLQGGSYSVNSLAFSPDGKLLAGGSSVANKGEGGQIRLWDTQSLNLMQTFVGHVWGINALVFSPDGKIIASGSADKTIKLWDVKTGKVIRTLTGPQEIITSLAFSPDGESLLSGSGDSTTRLWDVRRGGVKWSRKGEVRGVAFSPDGKLVAGAGALGVDLMDATNGKPVNLLIFKGKGLKFATISVAFSPDGKEVAATSEDKTIRIWDVSEKSPELFKSEKRTLSSAPKDVYDELAFSPDGRGLACGGWGEIVYIFGFNGGQSFEVGTHNGHITALAFSPDGKTLASANDTVIKLWDLSGVK